jgi:hypothetical protein
MRRSQSLVSFVSLAAVAAVGAVAPATASVTGVAADNSNNINAFGAPNITYRATGSGYAGIATQVTSGNTVGGNSWFGTTAWLRGGLVSGNTNVSMQWRTATTAERFGTSTVPPMADSAGYNSLSSDVLQLTGIAQTGPVTGGLIPTDAYALEMTYNPANLIQSYQFGDTMGWNLANIRASGEAQITYYNPVTGQWSKELVVINTTAAKKVENFFGTYDQWVTAWNLANPTDLIGSTTNLAAWVGSYGFYYTDANGATPGTYQMWAILDHTSIFGATPAPGAVALLGMAGLLGGSRRRRA